MAKKLNELEEALNKKFLFVKRNCYERGFHTFHIDFPNWGFYLVVCYEGSEIWLYYHGERDRSGYPDIETKYNGTIKHCFDVIENEFLAERREQRINKRKFERILAQRYSPPVKDEEMETWLDSMGGHLDGQRTWKNDK